MRKFDGMAVGISKGSALVFSAFDSDGEMWVGQGPRVASYTVRFDEAYHDEPIVHVSMSMWDIGAGQNVRADVSADEISPDGFRIVFRTWGDTRVARVRVDWIAIGTTQNEDDFFDI